MMYHKKYNLVYFIQILLKSVCKNNNKKCIYNKQYTFKLIEKYQYYLFNNILVLTIIDKKIINILKELYLYISMKNKCRSIKLNY